MEDKVKLFYCNEMLVGFENGIFFVLILYEIKNIDVFEKEVFGFVVYIVCFKLKDFDSVLE